MSRSVYLTLAALLVAGMVPALYAGAYLALVAGSIYFLPVPVMACAALAGVCLGRAEESM